MYPNFFRCFPERHRWGRFGHTTPSTDWHTWSEWWSVFKNNNAIFYNSVTITNNNVISDLGDDFTNSELGNDKAGDLTEGKDKHVDDEELSQCLFRDEDVIGDQHLLSLSDDYRMKDGEELAEDEPNAC